MIFIFKLILLLIIAAVFIVIAIWCRKRHTQFTTNAVEVNGTSVGSIRVDLPREVKTMYAQKVFFDCPFTKKRRYAISDVASETPKNDEGKQVKVYVATAPPHGAKLNLSSSLVVSLVFFVMGSFWLFFAIYYAAKHV